MSQPITNASYTYTVVDRTKEILVGDVSWRTSMFKARLALFFSVGETLADVSKLECQDAA